MLDLAFARSQFPALATDWALFDNAGGSPPLEGVIRRVGAYMRECPVQLGASYALSAEAGARVAAGRDAVARLVNAPADEIVLNASTTANVRLLARSLRPLWREGDEIVVTNLDHEANVGAWRELAREGLVVREWALDPATQSLTAEGLAPLLGARTRLVAFTACANVVGALHDTAALVRTIHDAGALACVDAVALAPHRRVDVAALGADVTLVSLYKVFGPHLGLMHVRREVLARLASQNHFFHGESPGPYKLEPGNVVHELTASLPAVAEYVAELGRRHAGRPDLAEPAAFDAAFAAIAEHEAGLVGPLLDFLRSRPDVHLLGPDRADAARRVPTVAFHVDGRRASEIPAALEADRVAIRWGHFYAHRAIAALGLADRDGVVRASLAHYNTAGEVARLVASLERALGRP